MRGWELLAAKVDWKFTIVKKTVRISRLSRATLLVEVTCPLETDYYDG